MNHIAYHIFIKQFIIVVAISKTCLSESQNNQNKLVSVVFGGGDCTTKTRVITCSPESLH
jgi:hypothetical protein